MHPLFSEPRLAQPSCSSEAIPSGENPLFTLLQVELDDIIMVFAFVRILACYRRISPCSARGPALPAVLDQDSAVIITAKMIRPCDPETGGDSASQRLLRPDFETGPTGGGLGCRSCRPWPALYTAEGTSIPVLIHKA